MQAFGEGFVSYRPPVNTRTTELLNRKPNGNPEITLNWITPTRNGASTPPTATTC